MQALKLRLVATLASTSVLSLWGTGVLVNAVSSAKVQPGRFHYQ